MFWKINKAVCNLNFSWLCQLEFHIYLFLHCYGLLTPWQLKEPDVLQTGRPNSSPWEFSSAGIPIRRCYKKWIFLAAFWKASFLLQTASSYLETFQHSWIWSCNFQMQMWYKQDYLNSKNILRCHCDYQRTQFWPASQDSANGWFASSQFLSLLNSQRLSQK